MHADRQPIIGGNWKLNPQSLGEAVSLAGQLRNRLGSQRSVQVVLFPPMPFLHEVAEKLRESELLVGSQDLAVQAAGAFTGAVSAAMIRSVGGQWVLCGHSERRAVFGDSDAIVGQKLSAALAGGCKPVLCIGESLEQREAGQTFAVVAAQLQVLKSFQVSQLQDLVLAYEPVWAIGTGRVATPEQAQEVHLFIRQQVQELFGKNFAQQLRIQYGGSVKSATAAGLMAQPDIDGLLVGGASLLAEEFANIVRFKSGN